MLNTHVEEDIHHNAHSQGFAVRPIRPMGTLVGIYIHMGSPYG